MSGGRFQDLEDDKAALKINSVKKQKMKKRKARELFCNVQITCIYFHMVGRKTKIY